MEVWMSHGQVAASAVPRPEPAEGPVVNVRELGSRVALLSEAAVQQRLSEISEQNQVCAPDADGCN